MTVGVRGDSLVPGRVRARGGSKSINHTSMHRVKHEEMNESSAHGVPLPSGDRLSQSSGALTHETCGVIKPTQLPSGDCLSQPK